MFNVHSEDTFKYARYARYECNVTITLRSTQPLLNGQMGRERLFTYSRDIFEALKVNTRNCVIKINKCKLNLYCNILYSYEIYIRLDMTVYLCRRRIFCGQVMTTCGYQLHFITSHPDILKSCSNRDRPS